MLPRLLIQKTATSLKSQALLVHLMTMGTEVSKPLTVGPFIFSPRHSGQFVRWAGLRCFRVI